MEAVVAYIFAFDLTITLRERFTTLKDFSNLFNPYSLYLLKIERVDSFRFEFSRKRIASYQFPEGFVVSVLMRDDLYNSHVFTISKASQVSTMLG